MIDHGLIDACVTSETQLLLAETNDCRALTDLIEREVTQSGLAFFHWHPARGVTRNTGQRRLETGLADPIHFLIQADDIIVDAVFVFEDVAEQLIDPTFAATLLALAENLANKPSCVVCIDQDVPKLSSELEALAERYYPDRRRASWEPHLKSWRDQTRGQRVVTMTLPTEERGMLREALSGTQTEGAFRADASKAGRWQDISNALTPKATKIEHSNALEFFRQEKFPPPPSGAEAVKRQLTQYLSEPGAAPHKLLIASDPGCGRSLIPFLVGSLLDQPVLRINIADMLAEHNEEALRRLLPSISGLAKSFEPLVLWLQDCQDLFSKHTKLQDCLSAFEHQAATVVGTMDAATSGTWLDSCLAAMGHMGVLTKPSIQQRFEIFAKHLRSRHLPHDDASLQRLASISQGLTGADIESLIIAALRQSLSKERRFSMNRLLDCCEVVAANTVNDPMGSPANQLLDRGWRKLNEDKLDLAHVVC